VGGEVGWVQQRALSLQLRSLKLSLGKHRWMCLLAFGFLRDTEKPGVWLQHIGITLITAIFLSKQKYFITFNLEPGTNYTCVV